MPYSNCVHEYMRHDFRIVYLIRKNKLLKIDGVTVLLGCFGIKIVGTLLIQASGEYVNSIQTSHDGQGR